MRTRSVAFRFLTWTALWIVAPSLFAAQLVCDEETFDFGEQANTKIIEHAFILRNTGKTPLEILEIRETCGCAVSSLSDRRIPPGERARVEVKVSLQGRHGRQRFPFLVLSSDPAVPKLTLAVTGIVRTPVSLEPSQIFLGCVAPDQAEPRRVDLVVEDGRPVRVISVTSEADWVEGVFMPGDGTNDAGQVELRFRTPLPAGLIHTSLRIVTDHPKSAPMTLPVGAYVKVPAPAAGEETKAP